jgi:hypothetical protein
MRMFAALLVLIGHYLVSHTQAEAQPQNCKKLCRDDYTACVKAHTQGACKTNYDICVNHCPNSRQEMKRERNVPAVLVAGPS